MGRAFPSKHFLHLPANDVIYQHDRSLTQSRSRIWRRGRSRSPEQSRTGKRRWGRWRERRSDTSSCPSYHTDPPIPTPPPSWLHTPADLQKHRKTKSLVDRISRRADFILLWLLQARALMPTRGLPSPLFEPWLNTQKRQKWSHFFLCTVWCSKRVCRSTFQWYFHEGLRNKGHSEFNASQTSTISLLSAFFTRVHFDIFTCRRPTRSLLL